VANWEINDSNSDYENRPLYGLHETGHAMEGNLLQYFTIPMLASPIRKMNFLF
jgi:hypothetical protein